MRRWPTWLVVGALVALGAIAAADALRGSERTTRAVEPRREGPLIPPTEPAGSAMSGYLYYTDEGCVMRALQLPTLGVAPAPRWRGCGFSMAPIDPQPADSDAVWQPQGGLFAVDGPGGIELASPASAEAIRVMGHAPAFKPDGTFTYVSGDAVVEWATDCPRDARLFTLPGDNATARCVKPLLHVGDFGPLFPSVPTRIAEVRWLSGTRVLAVVGAKTDVGTVQAPAVMEGRRLLGAGPRLLGRKLEVETSPLRGYYSAWAGEDFLGVWDRNAHAALLPPLRGIRALTWSPDERWTAVATAGSVYVFRTNEGEARVRRLPIQARDLAWRS